MRDYAELVKALRTCKMSIPCTECPFYSNGDEPSKECATMNVSAADAIEELLAALPHWISAEERLPKKKVGDEGYVGYLVLSDGEHQIADFTNDKYMQTAYEFHVDGEYDPNVTHWMELPPKIIRMAI